MEIKKETQVASGGKPTAAQLAAINAQAKAQLTEEQVYAFSLKLCDDQVDRDGERFDSEALPALAALFVGKTGIIDHQWSAKQQVARIFETQVCREENVSYIKAWAYIRRGSNDDLIADIEAGIKKEVSVGCAMGSSVCSICGSEYGSCGHRKGEHYDGQVCCAILRDPVDAYEFSFVAVPAQREAGVLKAMGTKKLKELAEEFGAQGEYRSLYQDAQLGRRYRRELEDEVVRLCQTLDLGAEHQVLRGIVGSAGAEDLMALRKTLEQRVREMLPGFCQLSVQTEGTIEGEYLI